MSLHLPAPGARFRTRSRRLTMLIAAAAIAFAGFAAGSRPARADAEDILRFLAGAIIIGAIINAVDDNHTPRYIDRWVLPDSCLETVRVNHRNIEVYNARCLNRGNYHGLPNHCLRSFRVNGYTRNGYVAECLWDAGYRRENPWGQPPRYSPPRYSPPGYLPPGAIRPEPPVLSPPPYHGASTLLPAHCEMTYRENGQRRNGYWGSCLRDAGLRNLPDHCRLRTRSGDAVYNRGCLVNAGYRRDN